MERSLRTSQLRTPEPRPARWRRGKPRRKGILATFTVTAALLVLGLGTVPAGAAVASHGKAAPAAAAVTPLTSLALTNCLTGVNNTYEFYTWCKGTSPTSFRTIAYCADGQAVIGVEYTDGSGNLSYANCKTTGNQNSTIISGSSAGWGILECSNGNGTGTFAGYHDTSGDISQLLANWGATNGVGDITAGGTKLCQYSIGLAQQISPTSPV